RSLLTGFCFHRANLSEDRIRRQLASCAGSPSAPPSSTPIGKVADSAAASLRYADLGHGIQVCEPCTGSTHTRATASPRGEGVRCASYARRRESRSLMPCVVGTGGPLGGGVLVHRLALSDAPPFASGADFSPCIESSIAGHACAG